MPKKKLTKTQVKKKIKLMMRTVTDLTIDKGVHGANSLVPMSLPKIIAMSNELSRAESRVN